MAIITSKGLLSGKVGNLVYKVVNGRSVVSSLPRRNKGWFKPGAQHKRFALATKASSRVHRELKEFFLNLPPGNLSNKLTSLFIRKHEEITSSDLAAGWRKVAERDDLRFTKRVHPSDILYGFPTAEIEGEQVSVYIPRSSNDRGIKGHYRVPGDARWWESAFIVIHYNLDTESAQVVYHWESERYMLSEVDQNMYVDRPLVDAEGNPIGDGLLVVAFNLRAFAAADSTSYLNNKNFNLLNVLGVWVKG